MQMYKLLTYNGRKTRSIQAFIMFLLIYKIDTIARIETQEILVLKEACPTTSYFTTMFHPTIGQCAHQSLNDTTTPKLGMVPTRNKGTLADSHIAKDTTKTQPSQHSWFYQAAKELERLTAKLVSSKIEPWTHALDIAWILNHLHIQH